MQLCTHRNFENFKAIRWKIASRNCDPIIENNNPYYYNLYLTSEPKSMQFKLFLVADRQQFWKFNIKAMKSSSGNPDAIIENNNAYCYGFYLNSDPKIMQQKVSAVFHRKKFWIF